MDKEKVCLDFFVALSTAESCGGGGDPGRPKGSTLWVCNAGKKHSIHENNWTLPGLLRGPAD